MNNGVFTACDFCGEPLEGLFKNAMVKKQFLSIRGTVCLKVYDRNKVEHYVYANPDKVQAMSRFLHFCNGNCLDGYMEMRIVLKTQYHDIKGLQPVDYMAAGEVDRMAKEEPKIVTKHQPPPPPPPVEEKKPISTGFFDNFKY
jgi:hypothetical protein